MAVLVLVEKSECNVCIFGWQYDTQRTGSDEAQSSEEKVMSSGTNLKNVPFYEFHYESQGVLENFTIESPKCYILRVCLQWDDCCIHLHTISCLQCVEIYHQEDYVCSLGEEVQK